MSFIFGSEVAISPTWVAEFFAERTEIETRLGHFLNIFTPIYWSCGKDRNADRIR